MHLGFADETHNDYSPMGQIQHLMPGLGNQEWGLKPGFNGAPTLPAHPTPE